MTTTIDVVIIGAGPAGMQMSRFLGESKRNHIVLERGARVGTSFETFPRHKKLISLNKKYNYFTEAEYNMRHDWNSLLGANKNVPDYTDALFPDASVLSEHLHQFHKDFSLPIRFNTEVTDVDKHNNGYVVHTISSGKRMSFACNVLFVATGALAPNIPHQIRGIEHAVGYEDVEVEDLTQFRNKRVLIIGGGNSAFETADHMAGTAAIIHVSIRRPIKHAWDTHFVGDLRAVNNGIIDMYQLKSLHATIGETPVKIEKNGHIYSVTFHDTIGNVDIAVGDLTLKRDYDCVIRCTGFRWVPGFFSFPVPHHSNGRYPILSPTWESEGNKNLFFIGTSMQARDKKAASGFIHGFRYNVRSLYYELERRIWGTPTPQNVTALELKGAEALSEYVCNRLTVTASLFQMFTVLCDAFVVNGTDTNLRVVHYQDLPREGVFNRELSFQKEPCVYIVTLRLGFQKYPTDFTSNNFVQDSGTLKTSCGAFLHPVVEHYVNGEFQEEYHLFETLDIRFNVQFKPNESHATMSQMLLTQIIEYTRGGGGGGGEVVPDLLKLALPSATNADKRAVFAKVFPIRNEWSNAQRGLWKELHLKELKERHDTECSFIRLPLTEEQAEVVKRSKL